MRRLLALFKRSRCHKARCYWDGVSFVCVACDSADKFRLPSRGVVE